MQKRSSTDTDTSLYSQWMVNTNLKPLDPKECEELPKTKMTRALQDAYKIASQNHGIDHFRAMLNAWQEEQEVIRQELEEAEAEAERQAAERAARAEAEATEEAKEKKKKAPRKSKDRKSTRLNSSHSGESRMPSSA